MRCIGCGEKMPGGKGTFCGLCEQAFEEEYLEVVADGK